MLTIFHGIKISFRGARPKMSKKCPGDPFGHFLDIFSDPEKSPGHVLSTLGKAGEGWDGGMGKRVFVKNPTPYPPATSV